MQKQARLISLQKEIQNPLADSQIQIKRAIDKLELPCASVQENLHRLQERIHVEVVCRA